MNMTAPDHQWITKREDFLAGRWLRADGTCYCEWQWDADTSVLTVSAEGIEDEIKFEIDDYHLQLNGLTQSLPDISRHHIDRRRTARPKRFA